MTAPATLLRDYQREAIADTFVRFEQGHSPVPVVMATGLGKTFTFAHLTDEWLAAPANRGKRALWIAHTDELIDQAERAARRVIPGRRTGVVKAERNETHAEIIISSRQTLAYAKRRDQLRNVGLIIVDEAHHAVRDNTYGRILEHFGALIPTTVRDADVTQMPAQRMTVQVAGFTATFARGDKKKLSTVWNTGRAPFSRDILFGIRHGYLLDVAGKRVVVPDLDMRNVGMRGGDYADSDIADELERTFAPEIIARAYVEHAGARKGLAFWPLVDTAYHGAEAFTAAGIPSAVVHGGLPKTERRLILKRFRAGEIQVIHNCAVLTEGFDEPTADVVVIARPTRSAPLYQQMVGRVLRPDLELPPEQRGKALILDVVGASGAHDLRSLIDLAPDRPLAADHDEDLSLADLDELLERELEQESAGQRAGATFGFDSEDYAGSTTIESFDPLGRDKLWSRTRGGTWYMPAPHAGDKARDQYVFLVDSVTGDPGTYDVVWCFKNLKGRGTAGLTEHAELPLDLALGWGEEEAIVRGGVGTKTLTARKSPWRKAEPTEPQKRHARARGINPEGMTKGEVSQAIDQSYATERIDPLVRAVTGQA